MCMRAALHTHACLNAFMEIHVDARMDTCSHAHTLIILYALPIKVCDCKLLTNDPMMKKTMNAFPMSVVGEMSPKPTVDMVTSSQ